ncbi:methylated-DNA--[protein]-cysteine S-methyltransferase [Pseudonocardia sp.]|uniref:methylated-DNA--[protein]-cysteine S-methyltransferase n=1 Tax=Pseudonocardia sp. TaxID=60912 RepID=UPI003D108216
MITRSHRRPTVVRETALGAVTLSASPRGLTRVRFGPRPGATPVAGTVEHRLLDQAARELDEYLAGRRTGFDVPVDLSAVEPEHRRVLDALHRVPYGGTCSYAELARAAGLTEDGPRRAGAACARNPVLVVVPCHRVVAASGALTGYAGGLAAKRALLALERGQFMLDAAGW